MANQGALAVHVRPKCKRKRTEGILARALDRDPVAQGMQMVEVQVVRKTVPALGTPCFLHDFRELSLTQSH